MKTEILHGLEMIGQGATTKIYRDGNTAIKLYVNAWPGAADYEAVRQRFAYAAGLPVPAVRGVRELGGGAVALDMEYIDGAPIIRGDILAGNTSDINALTSAMRTLVGLHHAVHSVRADTLPKLTDRLKSKIDTSPLLNVHEKASLAVLLARLDDRATYLCHGDFHPLNILYDGRKHWTIDWVDAAAGNPLADVCRTYLLFLQHMELDNRVAELYLKMYRECACERGYPDVNPDDVLAWLPVVAAARLCENIDDKSKALLYESCIRNH